MEDNNEEIFRQLVEFATIMIEIVKKCKLSSAFKMVN